MILVTGATGFVGGAVVQRLLLNDDTQCIAVAVRRADQTWPAKVQTHVTGDLEPAYDWSTALSAISAVVHCAARVHVMTDTTAEPLQEFRRVNVQATLNLARQAAAAGVRRFVFVSSIKVNGESTQPGSAFTADDAPAPLDAYGISKMEAEQGLREIALQTGMDVVIIRPPLVYGPGVKANFAAMMRWLRRGVPLPLGDIQNQRSLVALDNLVDLIVTCITQPAAANQTFLVSDGEDVSTTELLRRMGQALGCPARLLPVPASWLKTAAAVVGKADMAQRLCGSLQVDISKTRQLLGWQPPLSLDEGLKKAAMRVNK
ncbi:N-acetyl-alpha-D-glucosaminyl-diphospho-ditrans,octacis-undecaprenol 4-epimerase [Polaromonas vacuolata]|uniref:N-acetyl-alpha-D-glucosaminyl-diphospho-ditrans, octacis-undecaprenol 4-epimerase n=1 Tax=Polaromonas vacuolata TaxID=37448 RepID=A0A6H2H587_9BURK|nr:SDR family oxidoreductase [Polaromonas vacuolata]QJC55018.1 N-acetyl-alpha-D-glucosaminyl-diphospho-ditrans,octacis-undecaprenol 4-epimerase [Polaromonas vacuolata]